MPFLLGSGRTDRRGSRRVKRRMRMFQLFKKKAALEEPAVLALAAVADGRCVPLEEVNDPVFAGKALGDGIAIVPEDCVIAAPCDGTVSMLAETLHAFGMTRDDGLELMVHIGIDTVALKGEGFEALAAQGAQVKKGDPLIRFDAAYMQEKGIDMTTMLILLNPAQYQAKMLAGGQQVKKGVDTVIECSR